MRTRNKKLRGKKRKMKNLAFFVPNGMYCNGYRKDGKWVHPCPFLKIDRSKTYQENGVCEAFKIRDSEHGTNLWDWVKECDINNEYE